MEVDYKLYFWMCKLGIFAEPESLANQSVVLPKDIAQKFESGFIICKILESLKTKVKPEENQHVNFRTVKDTSNLEEIVQNWTFLIALLENGYSLRIDRKVRELIMELDKTMICEMVNILFEKFHTLDPNFQRELDQFEQRVRGLWILRGNSAETDKTMKNRLPTPYHPPQETARSKTGLVLHERTQTGQSLREKSAVRRPKPKPSTEPTAEEQPPPDTEPSGHIQVHDYEDDDVEADGGSHLAEEEMGTAVVAQKKAGLGSAETYQTRTTRQHADESVVLNQSEFMEGSQISVLEHSLLLNKSLLQVECRQI